MSDMRLGNLTIENFRSLHGSVSIPLDASIVLLHGSNGMGKTSVLSALELALTGRIEHLERVDTQYTKHLLHRGTSKGSIKVTQAGKTKSPAFGGSVQITDQGRTGRNLLAPSDAKFFAERCYLPQSTLGRLLELYQDIDSKDKSSPLTRFVKDLLGLDQLDAIVDGLHSAFNVTRVRSLISEFRRWEGVKEDLAEELKSLAMQESQLRQQVNDGRGAVEALIHRAYGEDESLIKLIEQPADLAKRLRRISDHDQDIIRLTRARQELISLQQRWSRLPRTRTTNERLDRERAVRKTLDDHQKWYEASGSQLYDVVQGLKDLFPNLPPIENADPIEVHAAAESSAFSEHARCSELLQNAKAASDQVANLIKEIQGGKARIQQLDEEIAKLAADADELARQLADISSHVHDDICPVCNRDFSETGKQTLDEHISASIAALTRQAGRLKAYTQEKSQQAASIRRAEQNLIVARKGELTTKRITDLTVRESRLKEALDKLKRLQNAASNGSKLQKAIGFARDSLAQLSRYDDQSVEIREDVKSWTVELFGQPIENFETMGEAIEGLLSSVNNDVNSLRSKQTSRQQLQVSLTSYIELINQLASITKKRESVQQRGVSLQAASRTFDSIRNESKAISMAAANARAAIVGRVFNTALNKMWRDLFVRLAPNEQFVPAFKIPEKAKGAIEASLETVHRRDQSEGGPPGTMLSAGNLNTAALTLFLALHLSVSRRLPWLILDDPVQSMDDVHISQFAALLRSVSKGLDRQVVLAVHDRALFDYLVLELSPAFDGDKLITVELSRTTDGRSVATPTIFTFKLEKAIAA